MLATEFIRLKKLQFVLLKSWDIALGCGDDPPHMGVRLPRQLWNHESVNESGVRNIMARRR